MISNRFGVCVCVVASFLVSGPGGFGAFSLAAHVVGSGDEDSQATAKVVLSRLLPLVFLYYPQGYGKDAPWRPAFTAPNTLYLRPIRTVGRKDTRTVLLASCHSFFVIFFIQT